MRGLTPQWVRGLPPLTTSSRQRQQQMQRLMTVTTGKIQRNGEQFFMLLASKEIDPACEIAWFEGQYTCLLPDGSAWIFARTDLKIKRKTYRQITATDITERWKLTEALRAQNKELTRRKDGLIRTLNNLQALSRERETQRARMRAHDILGERLTLLLRMVRGEPAPDYDLLRSLTARLMDELKEAESVHAPQDDMEILKQTFASIGVEVLSCGTLPQDPEKGKLLVDISKEAVTNAVRHGFATKVYITMRTGEGCHHMQITDNGGLSAGTMNDEPPADTMNGGMSAWTMNDRLSDNTMSGESPADTIKEGGGISGMRNRLAALGGTLRVTARPGFTLTIDLPEDEKDAEDAYR